jgi:MerR family copper efflux transcriptional regulator
MNRRTTAALESSTARKQGLLNIGEAAKASGVSAKMIRHYESIGLIGAARRTDVGYRIYSQQDVQIFQFVHRGRELGFSPIRLASFWPYGKTSGAPARKFAH